MQVGCKLPNGLVLQVGEKVVTLNGANQSQIIGAGYGVTDVDDGFYKQWQAAVGKDFAPLTSGAVFSLSNAAQVADVKTGLEPIDPEDTKSRVRKAK